ncbi:MAG: Fic family protein [Bacteroidales bacterium]|nr:Fic family protein [Bacteroidales bacterium]
MTDGYLNFDEYIRQGEPAKRERADAWRVAIGLQAVDGLKTSEYLQETARRNIEGEITIDQAREMVKQYYVTKTTHDEDDAEKEEADKVSSNISKLLQTDAFTYSVAGLAAIHKAIFEGVFKHAGQFREYDISKKEWVLRGDSVLYGRWQDLRMAIEYDLEQERQFDYSTLDKGQMMEHLAKFVAGIWQTHPFREGNTRATAVFTIKYLRSQGFQVNNQMFEQHSWYFRNALVRANYRNLEKGIGYEPMFLVRFFRNLLLGENNILKNRYMIINPPEEWKMPESEQTPDKYRTSTGQTPDKLPDKLPDKFDTNNLHIKKLITIIGRDNFSIKEMMDKAGLKNRESFMDVYLNPAIKDKFVRLLYPKSPRHPRQKYLLTVKGLALYNELTKGE